MRTLVILRGAPGAGKSTWIREHNLEAYTLCPDEIRLLCSSYELKADGTYAIAHNQEVENQTWKILFNLLEFRMSRGEFTIIDGTASKTKDIQQYKELASQYRYRMYCIDFSDVPLETCVKQNKQRPEYKWVPNEAIENIYARFATQKVPAGVPVIKPNEFEQLLEAPFDMSNYKKIVFIGDIHGCYDTLMQYFKGDLDSEAAYIFLGDYFDRGNQNAEVLNWLYSIMDKPNVCLLEGNHERHLRNYGNDSPSVSRVFENQTRPQLINGGFDAKKARMFYRKLRQMSHFTYNGFEILACHGGIPSLKHNLLYLPASGFIKGVGDYKDCDVIAETWTRETSENAFLIHGHRNTEKHETQIADRVFNLEGAVEMGGQLRIVELNQDLTWNIVEINSCQPIAEETNTEEFRIETVEQAVQYLRKNKFVQEKHLGEDISSFNFTREAFYSHNWNNQTILARGLFIDTNESKIMARSYEKFFRINEVRDTELIALKDRLQFPVKAWLKENGFLGIVSYDYKKDDLFIASKSTNKGNYVGYFTELLAPYRDAVLGLLRGYYNHNNPVTLVFEVEDIEHDPHIIQYDVNKIVLLDIIKNTLKYQSLDEELLNAVSRNIGCPVKQKAYVLNTWEDFRTLYMQSQSEDYQYNGEYIEGFVFEDASGFMTKCKTGYYNLWKKLRGVCDQTLRCGYITRTGMLTSAVENYFYGFCKGLYQKDRDKETKVYPYKTDIISIREKFLFGS